MYLYQVSKFLFGEQKENFNIAIFKTFVGTNVRTYDNNTCTNVPTYILYQCITIKIWSYIVHTYIHTYLTSYYVIAKENITWCAYCARNVQMFYLMIQTFTITLLLRTYVRNVVLFFFLFFFFWWKVAHIIFTMNSCSSIEKNDVLLYFTAYFWNEQKHYVQRQHQYSIVWKNITYLKKQKMNEHN